MCGSAYSWVFICNQGNTCDAFAVIPGHAQSGDSFEVPREHVPSQGQTRQHPAFLSELSFCKQVSFHGLFIAMFFPFLCFSFVTSFKISLKCSIGRMSNVTKSKEAVQCLMEKSNRQGEDGARQGQIKDSREQWASTEVF